MDVYSYSHEYPFRIDFFGDEIDSIRTFEVDSQLSRDKKESVEIVPELTTSSEKISFFRFLPSRTLLAMKDVVYVKGVIDRTYREGFSSQAMTERMEGKTEIEQQELLNEFKAENKLLSASAFAEDIQLFRVNPPIPHRLSSNVILPRSRSSIRISSCLQMLWKTIC
jgi:transcription-repair coupling factor (superfamily II helicase)